MTEETRKSKKEEDVKEQTKCDKKSKKEGVVDREDVKEARRGTTDAALLVRLLTTIL